MDRNMYCMKTHKTDSSIVFILIDFSKIMTNVFLCHVDGPNTIKGYKASYPIR
jgi:hypothetical protein